ncbi:aminotransferase class III-fold pyridoxal phosphate-dependent enzyme [Tenacibaculum ovolyticum]|uniref:aminotransferase class III-fold pyridoxal phosphate-dependent enzyme n=1 Tax=Tenacibaculum ovolyticum TaxID=104270 RepID=UPI000407131A|nr:aminotransferase class III-fold pyridoxal phosphate-dependent enzyme [Tenacibaculum ovolyticum]
MNLKEEERFNNLNPLKKALFKIEKYKTELTRLKAESKAEDIAIIGMALNFPEAASPEQFWNNILDKKDAVSSFSNERKEQLASYYHRKGIAIENMDFQEAAYLDNIDSFDYDFFKFAPSSAITTHPLHRLYLNTSWRALENAGYLQSSNKEIGVYFGSSGDITYSQYLDIVEESDNTITAASLTGNTNSVASSRLSYFMDLRGPAVTIDTACSSSLVAVHQACNSLLNGDSKIAIAGGGKIHLLPEKGKYNVGFESPTNRTKPFDINSDGAGIGEGVAAIVLKKLSDAVKDNDNIYAVIKGTAINQDGTSSGVVAPNPKAQTAVIKEAAKKANINLETLSYIETHGTGTQLGDPIEFQGLSDAFKESTQKQFCALGSVKSNIGHLFEAAGIAGLIKSVLALQNKVIPPSINHTKANSNIDFENSPFYFNTEKREWKTDSIRRCGVSSFGISGTNAHVILEEYQEPEKTEEPEEELALFTLSAHNKETLDFLISDYKKWVSKYRFRENLSDTCYSINKKNGVYNWRFSVLVSSINELKEALRNPENYITTTDFLYKNHKDLIPENKEAILKDYKKGAIISWKDYYKDKRYKNIALPIYPLKQTSCWPKFEKKITVKTGIKKEEIGIEETHENLNYFKVYEQLSTMIFADTGIRLSQEMKDENLFDLGIDSIIILQFIQTIKRQYRVVLEMGQFYETVGTLEKLTNYIVTNGIVKGKKSTNKKQGSTYAKAENVDYFVPYKEIVKNTSKSLTDKQSEHLDVLTDKIVTQTKKTKDITQEYRTVLANNRNVAGFKPETKEITYQIIAKKSKGSKIIDLNNNEYVDLTMGFGVNILGYNPDFIEKALQEELKKGYAVGPMNEMAGKVAALISELTGNERIAFYNSGSEAVMVALRLARATTGKSKYVIFKESYHGTFDGILALSNPLDLDNSIPLAPGVTDNFINNTIVLEYGSKASLEYIRENADELAAVLIEPVQSRRPDLQPTEFIQEVRKITKSSGTALIFDEVITGFRIALGGAKKWFDVEPDLCTYGKVVGGGMPVGVVAGNAQFMDAVDGGTWQFGDDSFPNKPTTFVAGTFNQHPLTMRASYEVLSHLKEQGNQLQENLNKKTTNLVKRINTYFKSVGATAKVVNFGSLFRFNFKGGWDLFYQHLLANKVYVWEGRNCFLSTAHTDEDIEFIYQAIVKATDATMQSGWVKLEETKERTTIIPFSEEQEQLYALSTVSEEAMSSFNENQIVDLKGDLDIDSLKNAFIKVVNRHEALRTSKINNLGFHISKTISPKINVLDANQIDGIENIADFDTFLGKQGSNSFSLEEGPFIRMLIIKVSDKHYKVLLTSHHLIADGYSIELIWNELSKAYSSELKGKLLGLLPAAKLSSFNKWLEKPTEEIINANKFWKNEFSKKYPKITLPSNNIGIASSSRKGSLTSKIIDKELQQALLTFAKETKSTIFNTLFTVYTILLQRLSGQNEFVVGVPSAGQLLVGEKYLVGQCVKMLPLYITINEEESIENYLKKIRLLIANAVKYQYCSFNKLIQEHAMLSSPKITTEMDMNSVKNNLNFEGLETTFLFPEVDYVKYDLSISIIEMNDTISLDFYYNTQLFDEETIENWGENYITLLKNILKNTSVNLSEITIESKEEENAFSGWNNL